MAKKVESKKITTENEMLKFVKMIVIVTLIFLAFYVLTIFINKKEDEIPKNNNTPASIQYDEILIGNIFSQPNDSYYVLVEDNEDLNVQIYKAYLQIYKSIKDSKRYYNAVLNNAFNSKYYSNETVIDNDITKLKFKETTLLEISDNKIVNSFRNNEEIINHLKQITKSEEQ